MKEWPLLQEQFSETACLSNGFSAFIKTIYFHWTLQDKHQSQEECTMKFIITLQKQILGAFSFAQVKMIFFSPQRDKGIDGGGGLIPEWFRSGSSEGFQQRGALQSHPQRQLADQWKLGTKCSLSDEWSSVPFGFFTKGSYRGIRERKPLGGHLLMTIIYPCTSVSLRASSLHRFFD